MDNNLQKENKRLKRINCVLVCYVVLTIIIQLYNMIMS